MADIITLIVGPVALYLVSLIVGIVAPSLLGLFDAVAPHLLDPIGRELDYLFHYRSNIEKLSEEVDELQKVSETIKAAWTNAGEIELNVQEWLTSVDGIIKNALKFLEDEKKENEGFFNRLCAWLNLKSWYQKSKKAKQRAAEIVPKIQERKQFSSPPPPKIKIPAVEGYEAFKSRMPILTKIIESLSNANVNLIGVYGMGGTGKTTLVNEIARKCEEDKILDEVVIATVSQSPKIIEIQGEISDKLNLKLEKESESGRAGQLCEELKKLLDKKSILVILDDIWKKLDLAKVGIPFGDSYKGCKIMMTSRNQHLLSTEMGTQQDFSIEVLPKKEAWDLFKKTAGDLIEAPELKAIATEIVKQCAGLPLAVKAVANALKNRDSSIWRDALVQLESSGATNIAGIDPKLYSSLKLSYDFLESDEVRSLFLLCCLLPEDYNISIQDFLKYGKGLGLFQGTLKKSRDRAHALVAHLKGSCLLLDGSTTESVRVHDVVRDVGISIASKDKNMLTVRNEDQLEDATEERLRNCPAISLPFSNIQELPKELECPELKFLLLLSRDHSLAISDNFFEGMKRLKVLNLTKIHFSSLPSSLYLLSNLQTLCLDQCLLQDIARIGELKKLEVLSFASSDIRELPREIGQLTRLRLLDLKNCSKLEVIPPNVIAGFSQLEDLYMEKSFVGWEVNGNASLSELEHLSSLVTLDIHIRDAMILPKDLRFEKLLRYRIFIGDGWDWSGEYKTTRTLKLKPITRIQQEFGIQSLLKGTEDLYLEELKDIRSVLYDLDGEGFPHLKHLHIQKGCEIEYVINTMEWLPNKAFPNLESLFLSNLIKLKEICQGQIPPECFSKLKSVNVASCGGLKNLFSLSIARRLSQLQELEIYECKSMDEIVGEEREGSEGNKEAMDKIIFPQLRSLRLCDLPKLTSFYSKGTTPPSLNYTPTINAGSGEIISEGEHDIPIPLFNEKVAFPNLEVLSIRYVNSLTEIWPSQLPVDDGSFCNLKSFDVDSCEHLLNIIPSNMLMRLQNMERLSVSGCGGSLEYIFDLGGINDKERHVELRDLDIWNLPGLKQIWKKDPQTNFLCQKLSSLQVFKCGNLRSIFTTSMVKSLKQLQNLSIRWCEMVEEIVEEDGVEEQAMDEIVFPQLTSLTLENLPLLKSFCQRSHILEWPSSKKLDVCEGDNVETFALESSSFEEMCGKDHLGTPTKQPVFLVDKVAFPNLEVLSITKVNSLKEIWPSQLSVDDHSFCKLKSLRIRHCDHLLNIGLSNMLMRLRNLESLDVWNHKLSEEYIFDVGELNDMERHILRSIPLRELSLSGYPGLKQIWKTDSQLSGYFPFQNLTSLEVTYCSNLRHIFTTSIAKSLVQLQKLEIWGCEMVEEIVGNEGVEEESMGKIVFSGLTSLTLNGLLQLKSFSHGILKVETFSLESSSLEESHGKGHVGTPTKQPLFLVDKVVFPNLEKLKLESMSRMKEIWQDQYYAASFGKLRDLEVCDCESLTHVLPFAIAKSLVQIQSIIVDNCKMMKEVIASEERKETDETTFSQLKSLKLRNLPNLTSFYTRSNSFSFPSLEEVLVEKCPELKTFSYGTLHTPKLDKVLVLSDLNTTIQCLFEQKVEFLRHFELSKLKQICHDEFTVKDCYVRYLVVEKYKFLLKVFSSTMLERFFSNMLESIQKLEKIKVESCDSLEQVFELVGLNCDKERAEPLSDLEEMNLTEHPNGILCLRCIWNNDPKGILSFQYLRRLNIHKCNSLRNLFSCSMALNLQLEGLEITDCLNMEEIVNKEKGAMGEAIDKIVFRYSRYIILQGLPNLTSFYPGNHTLEFPSLSLMKIIRCPRMKTFTSIDVPSAPLFINNEVTFPNLEEFIVDSVSLKEIWHPQLPVGSFCKLKKLDVYSCNYLLNIVPSNMLTKLQNLELLTVMDMFSIDSLEYVFDLGGLNDKEKQIGRTTQLRDLGLRSLWKLKQIWKTDSQVSGYFPFQNLTSLNVIDCRNLRHIFTTSMAKSLVQLKELEIVGCWEMEEIVENEVVEAAATDKIVFPRVICLSLIQLEQLKSFCQGNRISEWPSLKRVLLNDCSDIEIFASELSSFEESQGKGKGHVGTPRKQPLFLVDKVAFPKLDELKLVDMRSLKEIWQGQFHALSFCKLTTLEVQCCGSLTHLLPSAIAKSLVQIKSIFVRDCWMMTEIIASEEREEAADEITFSQLNSLKLKNLPDLTSIYAGSNSFSFPTLKEVLVEKCPKLNTFSIGMLNTPALEKVHIESEGLFGEEVVVMDKRVWKDNLNSTIQHLFLQKMEFLRLSEQSELKQICYDQFPVEACYVRYLVVEKCTSLLNVVSSNMLESLRKLEKITVESCDSLEQVFDLEGLDCDEKRGRLLPDLEEMNLTELPKLRCIWNKDPKGILSFKYLRRLNIHKCNSLRNVFSLSMVPDLWRHGGFELKITDCLNMEEIIEMEKEAIDKIMFHEIMFQCSRCILQGLPNLTSFYPGNHTLVFTNLGTLKIAGCPRIKTFTSTNEGLQETSGDGNVDVPSSALFINNKVKFPWLVELELEDLYIIKEIWHGQLHGESFCDLTTLTVHSCQNLTHLLPFAIAKRLAKIKSIIIDGCEMMKEIIAKEKGEEADHETTFTQLSSLKLRSLPNLVNFCTGSNTFSFPSLEQVLVEECPKLETFSNGILNTPKLEKVHLWEDEWEWKGDLNTTIQHLFTQK